MRSNFSSAQPTADNSWLPAPSASPTPPCPPASTPVPTPTSSAPSPEATPTSSTRLHPEHSTHIPLKPVVSIHPTVDLLLFTGFHTILAWGSAGEAWHTQRLSWEGIRITGIEGDTLHGLGWNLITDQETPFTVDLRTGRHQGGGVS